jgi:hypothetical protein
MLVALLIIIALSIFAIASRSPGQGLGGADGLINLNWMTVGVRRFPFAVAASLIGTEKYGSR